MEKQDTRENVNQRQKEFYESKNKNFATKIWSYFRNGLLTDVRKKVGVQDDIYALHRMWLGDLSGKKVLDLGCYEGNALSVFLAENSGEYIGIDLSESGIAKLNTKLEKIPNAKGVEMDFLSEEFDEKNFDWIYAYGVLHHFKDTDELIRRLKAKLKPDGKLISYDPLQTNFAVKLARKIYRPFQSDKDWEWPFKKETFQKYHEAFYILEKRAVLGKLKWFFIISLLPLSSKRKLAIGRKWHRRDWETSNISSHYMFNCMQLTMLMKNKIR